MGLLDDVLGSAVPGGNLAKPLMIAATRRGPQPGAEARAAHGPSLTVD
jgi:hypothetical protein